MKILRSTITIISEIVVLTLSILWYLQTKDYEPLIAIIVTSVGLILSFLSRLFVRPKLVLHKQKNIWGRSPKGYTANNPQIIRICLFVKYIQPFERIEPIERIEPPKPLKLQKPLKPPQPLSPFFIYICPQIIKNETNSIYRQTYRTWCKDGRIRRIQYAHFLYRH